MSKNILIVASKFPPEYSGPGVRIIRLYKSLREQGYDFNVQIFCNGIEHNKNETYIYEGFKVRRITEKLFSFLFRRILSPFPKLKIFALYQVEFIKSVFTLLTSNDYKNIDLIHLFGNSGGTAAALLFAKTRKIPVFMELVTASALPQQKILGVFKIRPSKDSHIMALTEKTKQTSLKLGFKEAKIWCRPNPIDEKIFKIETDKKQSLRKKLSPFHENDIIINSVAKLMPQKNQLLIIDILKHLPKNYKALIAGPFIQDGPLYERDLSYVNNIKEKIVAYNLQTRVHLIFNFVDSAEYMKASDIYLLPAWDEGFGTPMMEAMACGLPVIANKDENAFSEWIIEGENGYLCDISSPQDWAQTIEKAAQFSNSQKQGVSTQIQEKAGQTAIYKQYEGIIQGLLEPKN